MLSLYIACSLDGYIAGPNNELDWLEQFPNPEQTDYGYFDYLAGVDAVLMGRHTYEQILSFPVDWPYAEKACYLVSSQRSAKENPHIQKCFSSLDQNAIEHLHRHQKVWLVGGGQLIKAALERDLLDELIITTLPRLIGRGIPLFPGGKTGLDFRLKAVTSFSNGVISSHYQRPS